MVAYQMVQTYLISSNIVNVLHTYQMEKNVPIKWNVCLLCPQL